MLTTAQLQHFCTFGFVLLRHAFSADETVTITGAADALWQQDLEENGADAHGSQGVVPFVERSDGLAWLAEDDRIYLMMEQLLGPGFVWGGSEGNKGSFNETNDHQWHCDRAGQIDLAYQRVKIMIYLQAMEAETGALRVLPGSHHPEFHRSLLPLQGQGPDTCEEAYGVAGPELCGHPLKVVPGDLVVFDHYLFHGVYGKTGDRRYVVLKFAAEPCNEVQAEALREHRQDASQLHDRFRHSERPRISRMVDKLLYWEQQTA
ncbi:MAG: phytanoyl-CoA dioxygenase family protein [Candidatus Latescibacterota bacterium]|nr:phytanoyl-CoA dioxygenase family protein [Candidatus Latescibacterota bacterium]